MPVRNNPWPPGTPCWVDCQVDDPVKESEFYAGLFGWDIQGGGDDSGSYLMAMHNGRSVAGIGPKPQPDMPSVWTTYLAVEDADSIAVRVATTGGQVLIPPFDVMDAGRMAIAADPTGAVFAIWQARAHNGAEVYGEHGAYCWNELRTRALDAAKTFYAEVFGYTYVEVGDGDSMRYAMFTPPGAAEAGGGMNDDTKSPGDPVPAHWLSWFQYDGVDEGVSRAGDLGASVPMPAMDSPFGRMAVLAGPQDEAFGIIDTTAAVGEMPR